MNKEEKNQKIKNTLLETKKRHSNMICKTFEVKVISNKMNVNQRNQINTLFKEAKWIRNAYLNNKDDVLDNFKSVPVKVKDTIEIKPLEIIGSQIKQSVIKQINSEIKSLSSNKKNGRKIGKLKFKSYHNSLNLKQYGSTYKIIDNKHIKIQNIDKPLYVRGLKQIPLDAECCNAKFVRKVNGLYFYITCFIPKEVYEPTNKMVGIDFGIENNLNFSDDREVFNCNIEESKYIKRLSRKINRCWIRNNKCNSNNNLKRIKKIKIAYQKQNNFKHDIANKEIHNLLANYDFIAIQDEMLSNWQKGLFGKQIEHSCMGTIKAKLKQSSKVHVISRCFPSTQICPECGSLNKHPLSKRDYDCPHCGYHHDSRDIKSAQSILDQALYEVSMERRAKSSDEIKSSTATILNCDSKILSMTQEAQAL